MNKKSLLQRQKEMLETEIAFHKELGKWYPRAQEIAKLFKKCKMSLVINNSGNYDLKSTYIFKTLDDIRGLSDNSLILYEDNEHIAYICKDSYDDQTMGFYSISIDDFLRKDWEAYFTNIINTKKEKLIQKIEAAAKEKEYNEYLKLKEKFGE